jgi:hypothetical protein
VFSTVFRNPVGVCGSIGALLATLSLLAATATADPAPDRQQAKQLRDRGAEAMSRGNFSEALDCFRRANDVYPSPRLRHNIAVALDALGRHAEAVEYFEDFLSAAQPDSPGARDYALARIATLSPQLARLDLEVSPPGATVRIAARSIALPRPNGLPVPPGEFTIEAEHPGYARLSQPVTVAPGERRRVTLTLLPQAAPPPPAAPTAGRPQVGTAIVALRPARPDPLIKKRWFWAVVTSGVVVVAAGITLGVALGTSDRYPKASLGGFPGN